MAREQRKIALDPALLDRIDHARGDVPLSKWMARAAELYLNEEHRQGKMIRRLADATLEED